MTLGRAAEGPSANRRSRRIARTFFVLGAVLFGYLGGAAVMFFELPSSDFLCKAFLGARAWGERREMAAQPAAVGVPVISGDAVYQPDKAFNGYTLYVTGGSGTTSNQPYLINMNREVVHTWSVQFSRIWPHPPHIDVQVSDALTTFYDCYLFPNGDLLATIHGIEQHARGYGLVKLDKDSNVIWKYADKIHHDLDIGEDGTI
jgi:hypothetical protein